MLVSRVYKEILQIRENKTIWFLKEEGKGGAKDLNRHFTKEDIHMANKTVFNIIPPQRIQVKATICYYCTAISMAKIKKTNSCKYWQGCGATGTFIQCWWEYKWVQSPWKTVWHYLWKHFKHIPTLWSNNSHSQHKWVLRSLQGHIQDCSWQLYLNSNNPNEQM